MVKKQNATSSIIIYSILPAISKNECIGLSERAKTRLERTRRNGTKLGKSEALTDGLHERAVRLRS